MAWYEMNNDEHTFIFQCSDDFDPDVVARVILSQHDLLFDDFDLVEIDFLRNDEFCE